MNIRDVAKEAGVSIATVSRVLNARSDYPVRKETRQRVMAAVELLNFRPNDLARGLLLKKTYTIGLVVPDMSNAYYAEIARGVEHVASENLYAVIFCNTDRQTERAEHHINVLLQKQVDGIIIAGGGANYGKVADELAEVDTEVVVIGRHQLPFASIAVDNVAGGRLATEHLIALGHRRIGYITGPRGSTSAEDRRRGYEEALNGAGMPSAPELMAKGDFSERSGYQATHSMLRREPRPTAIFAANDRMAVGAMATAFDLGLGVPEDLAVVGFDNVPLASYVRPTLTTVALPSSEMGRHAADVLLASIGGSDVPAVTELPLELVVRESTTGERVAMSTKH